MTTDTDKAALSLTALEESLDRLGADISRWPPPLREAAQTLLAKDANARAMLEEHLLLAETLNAEPLPEFAGLMERVLNQPLPERQPGFIDRLVNWIFPPQGLTPARLLRPALAASLPLLTGLLLGNVFSFGVASDEQSLAAWDEELALLSLYDYSEVTAP